MAMSNKVYFNLYLFSILTNNADFNPNKCIKIEFY